MKRAHRARMRRLVVFLLTVGACGPGVRLNGDGGHGGDADTSKCGTGCSPDQVCVPDLGCRTCNPGKNYCGGSPGSQEVWQCNADGTGGDYVMACGANEECVNGFCLTACQAADMNPSTVGCHFYAVDLDNVNATVGTVDYDAAKQQFAVAVANVNDYPVTVTVTKNTAPFGMPIYEEMVTQVTVAGNDLATIDLPQREVDGTMGQNGPYVTFSGSGTFVSSHAYKIESDGPIVAYQFNPIIQAFTNDASLLVPHQALGHHYLVLSWPVARPCGPPPGDPFYIPDSPSYGFVTIVGEEEGTHVTVTATHPIKASGGMSGLDIAQTPKGTPLEFDIGPYDVVNLESDQPIVPFQECGNYPDQNGDFTGTSIVSSKPVAVFSGTEDSEGTADITPAPPPPPDWNMGTCCTDHLEEQMFPTEAWGWKYAVSRSPVRSTNGGYEEEDLYRVLASVDNTTVTTNLPAPYDHFTLNAGEHKSFYAYDGFTAVAEGGAIMLGQILVSQDLVGGMGEGDPSLMVFPAVDQYRDHYVFLIPTTFRDNYMVVALPTGTQVFLDGASEIPVSCDTRDIGTIDSKSYQQITCRLEPGVHRITASAPVGLSVYGYYDVGSYAYCGGSDVDIINPIQ